MKILFLDFDGVLHPVGAGVNKFTQLPLLEDFLREPAARDLRVVVSSTWREAYPLNSLRQFFSEDMRPRIVGCTPSLDAYDSDYERGEEIESWLAEHAPGLAWVALDDDAQAFSPRLKRQVVFTDRSTGLSEVSIMALRELLSR